MCNVSSLVWGLRGIHAETELGVKFARDWE